MFLLAIIGALIYCKSKSMYRKRNEVPADQLALKTISPRPFASSQENVAPSGIAPTPGPSSDGGKCSRQRSDSLKDGEALTQCWHHPFLCQNSGLWYFVELFRPNKDPHSLKFSRVGISSVNIVRIEYKCGDNKYISLQNAGILLQTMG